MNIPGSVSKLSTGWPLLLLRARLDFGTEPHQRKLTLTFNFLTAILGAVTTLTVVWAIGAGILHAGYVALHAPMVSASTHPSVWAAWANRLGPVIGAPIYILQAVAVALLVFIAASCVGAIVGFLFGVPRPISESGADTAPRPQAAVSTTTSPGVPDVHVAAPAATTRASADWKASTNLTQVSDWLTKIIVGVGLVESKGIYEAFGNLVDRTSPILFGGLHGIRLVVPCLMLTGLIMGFLYAYLFTQLFLASMMVYSAVEISTSPFEGKELAAAELTRMPADSSAIAGGVRTTQALPEPTSAQSAAAETLATVPLSSLTDAVAIRAWSRGRAIARDFISASQGYRKLLTLVQAPDVLAEAARVIAQSGSHEEARELLRRAVLQRDTVAPDVRYRITADAANLALYDPPPQGYTYALSLLDDKSVADDTQSGQLYVLRACARGQQFKATAANLTEEARQRLTDDILADVTKALDVSPETKKWLHYLWNPFAAGKSALATGESDNDLEPFFDDPRFKALLE